MKKIDLGQSIGILANIGILVSIVFLAIEISQNQATLEEQNTLNLLTGRDAALASFRDWRRLLLENPELDQVWDKGLAGEELTPLERSQFGMLSTDRLYMQLALYNRYEALNLVEESRELANGVARQIDNSETYNRYWEDQRDIIRRRGFGVFVEDVDSAHRSLRGLE